jgi:hypothetical protein
MLSNKKIPGVGTHLEITAEGKTPTQLVTQLDSAIGDTEITSITMKPGTLSLEAARELFKLAWHHDHIANFIGNSSNRSLVRSFYNIILWKRTKGSGRVINKLVLDGNLIEPVLPNIKRTIRTISSWHYDEGSIIGLSNCGIQEAQFIILFKEMFAYKIQEIDLSRNPIGNGSILLYFGNNKYSDYWFPNSLQKLNLAHTQITDEGALQLEQYLATDTNLQFLDLSGNAINPEILQRIEKHLQDNRQIAIIKEKQAKKEALDTNDRLIPCIGKMLKANLKIGAINNAQSFSEAQSAQLESVLESTPYITSINNMQNISVEAKAILAYNQAIYKTVRNQWPGDKGPSIKSFIANAVLWGVLGVNYFVVLPLAIISSCTVYVIRTAYNAKFVKELNDRKDPQKWTPADHRYAKLGARCSKSHFDIAWINPLSWLKPTAYLGYHLSLSPLVGELEREVTKPRTPVVL